MIIVTAPRLLSQNKLWISGYYTGWSQGQSDNGALPSGKIDYTAVTHIMHFSVLPLHDGSLDASSHGITAINSTALIAKAHTAGRKVLLTVGGAGTDVVFRAATNSSNRARFIQNLVSFVTQRGYDGIDVDWELLESHDDAQFTAFISELRLEMDQARPVGPKLLLTCALAWQPVIAAKVASKFDQINIMTYDLSGAWDGWISWHNAPLYNGGHRFPSTGGLVPSTNDTIDRFAEQGVPVQKLGIGIDFYGYVWSGGSGTSTGGVTQPRQSWSSAPAVQANVPYATIMRDYYSAQNYRWDSEAQAAYLTIDQAGSANDKFISFDDTTTCRRKIEYANQKGVGGVIIWDLAGGYIPAATVPDPLLQAVKRAVGGSTVSVPAAPSLLAYPNNSNSVSVTPTLRWNSSTGATMYRLQISQRSDFSSIVLDRNNITGTSFTLNTLAHNTPYYWRVSAGNQTGYGDWSAPWQFTTGPAVTTAVEDDRSGIPTDVSLGQNYPNPFNPSTTIRYELPFDSNVSLIVFNAIGQQVATLVDLQKPAGFHEVEFHNSELPSGVYIYRLTVEPMNQQNGGAIVDARKMQIVR